MVTFLVLVGAILEEWLSAHEIAVSTVVVLGLATVDGRAVAALGRRLRPGAILP